MAGQDEKWIWMMNYCKFNGYPPANKYFWDKAEKAYRKKVNNERTKS